MTQIDLWMRVYGDYLATVSFCRQPETAAAAAIAATMQQDAGDTARAIVDEAVSR